MTDSLSFALQETARRREKQEAWNKQHGITPRSVQKQITDLVAPVTETEFLSENVMRQDSARFDQGHYQGQNSAATIAKLEKRMREAAAVLEFETAARLRDEIKRLEAIQLGLNPS